MSEGDVVGLRIFTRRGRVAGIRGRGAGSNKVYESRRVKVVGIFAELRIDKMYSARLLDRRDKALFYKNS